MKIFRLAALCAIAIGVLFVWGDSLFLAIPHALQEDHNNRALFRPKNCTLGTIWPGLSLDADFSLPEELARACPRVHHHFHRFPLFNASLTYSVSTTSYAAFGVCTLTILKQQLASLGHELYLHAGSHLGALQHAGPIPWDDDIDAWTDFRALPHLKEALQNDMSPLRVAVSHNALKVWWEATQSPLTRTGHPWSSPFIDLFFYKFDDPYMIEVNPKGEPRHFRVPVSLAFPTQLLYFGGEYFQAPTSQVADERYDVDRCVRGAWNHRLESRAKTSGHFDCAAVRSCFLFRSAPCKFSRGVDTLVTCSESLASPPLMRSHFRFLTGELRAIWKSMDEESASKLHFKALDKPEVVNVFGLTSFDVRTLNVVVANVERGRFPSLWAEKIAAFAPDVVLLNEMDWGMARTGQMHTARVLAQRLSMNYAWGAEFIELTHGTYKEQQRTAGVQNDLGLHGNAILSKFPIRDARIFRDDGTAYLSRTPSGLNANGFERRLGGRMALLVTVSLCDSKRIVIGSVHKVSHQDTQIRSYIGSRPAVLGGDQSVQSCAKWALKLVGDHKLASWPASCGHPGRARGDIVCSNFPLIQETRDLPCSRRFGLNASIGDHAIFHHEFDVANLSPRT